MDFVKARLLDEELKISTNKTGEKQSDVAFNSYLKCLKCNKVGHKAVDCRRGTNRYYRGGSARYGYHRGRRNSRNQSTSRYAHIAIEEDDEEEEGQDQISFVALNCDKTIDNFVWILDSGASLDLIKGEIRKYAKNIVKLDKQVNIHAANGEIMIAMEKGEFVGFCQGYKIQISALLVEGIKHNLLSVGKLVTAGHKVIFNTDSVNIVGKTFKIGSEKMNNLYILHLSALLLINIAN
nr:unnamed protein product [Callosobruchus analis]